MIQIKLLLVSCYLLTKTLLTHQSLYQFILINKTRDTFVTKLILVTLLLSQLLKNCN